MNTIILHRFTFLVITLVMGTHSYAGYVTDAPQVGSSMGAYQGSHWAHGISQSGPTFVAGSGVFGFGFGDGDKKGSWFDDDSKELHKQLGIVSSGYEKGKLRIKFFNWDSGKGDFSLYDSFVSLHDGRKKDVNVAEPSSLLLIAVGLIGLGFCRRAYATRAVRPRDGKPKHAFDHAIPVDTAPGIL